MINTWLRLQNHENSWLRMYSKEPRTVVSSIAIVNHVEAYLIYSKINVTFAGCIELLYHFSLVLCRYKRGLFRLMYLIFLLNLALKVDLVSEWSFCGGEYSMLFFLCSTYDKVFLVSTAGWSESFNKIVVFIGAIVQ